MVIVLLIVLAIGYTTHKNRNVLTKQGNVIHIGKGDKNRAVVLTIERLSLIYLLLILTAFILFEARISLLIFAPISFLLAIGILYRMNKKRLEMMKYTVVPDSKIPSDLDIFEIGMLIDGRFDQSDLFSGLAYKKLNNAKFSGEIESILYDYTNKKLKDVSYYLNEKSKSKQEEQFYHISYKMLNILKRDGYISFNPVNASVIFLILSFIPFTFVKFANDLNIDISSDFREVVFGVAALGIFFALSTFFFHENYKKIIPIRVKIMGLKMYLKTTDYYRVKHDEKRFEEVIPYMISLNIHHKYLDDMIEYVDKRVISI